MKTMIVASGNSGKIKEIKEIFGNEFDVISIKEIGIEVDVKEEQETFEKNAIQKAETIAREIEKRTQMKDVWVLADDSGIEVEALNGFPGVKTKRWFDGTDRERNLALIQKLDGQVNRKVNFITAIAISNGKESFYELGVLSGQIAAEPRGENGFGFDEIFELEDGRTLAELTEEEKNQMSARKIALEKIREQI